MKSPRNITLGKTASQTRALCHEASFEFDVAKYQFRPALEGLFGVPLEELHKWLGSFDQFERRNDQNTILHRVFYTNYSSCFKPIYESFIENFISGIVKFPFAYQVIPTFRVGLPGNRFVGEYHVDSKYNHPDYELNFNLGLSNYLKPCCLMSERTPRSREFFPIECNYGSIFSFNHIDCAHGSDINTTSETMVSIDFRLAMIPFYQHTENKSINLGTTFSLGSYFSSKILNNR